MSKRLISVLAVCALFLVAALPVAAVGIDGTVELKPTEHVAWIDRLDLTHTDAAPLLAFYEDLKEGADNDGVNDFLIEDHPEGYAKDVAVLTGDLTASADTVQAEIAVLGRELMTSYKPFIMAVYDAFDRDHPEVFWLSGERLVSYGVTYHEKGDGTYSYTVTLRFVIQRKADGAENAFDIRSAAYPTASDIQRAIAQRDAAINEILMGVTTQSSYALLRYFNEALTTRNEYNTVIDGLSAGAAPVDSWECISALLGRTGADGPVCEGYARALKVLCDRVGIPCVLVDGEAKPTASDASGAHMWNYVQVGESWYGIDVTWNDPVDGIAGAVSGQECEKWFLHGANTETDGMRFLASHSVSNQASLAGVSFINGPTLSITACADPSALPETVLSEITVTNGTGAASVTYGDVLTVTLRASSAQGTATDQTVALYYKNVKLAESNTATDGVYQLTYNTLERKLPAASAQALTLRFAGDGSMAEAVAVTSVTLHKAASAVSFSVTSYTAMHTGSPVAVPEPDVTLLFEDIIDESALTYSYRQENGASGTGLPTEVGVYQVTVQLAETEWYLASTDEITLTVTAASQSPSDKDPGAEDDASGAQGPASSLVNVIADWTQGSSLDTVMIVCASIGGACILIAILFGRKKKKKEKETDQDQDQEDGEGEE